MKSKLTASKWGYPNWIMDNFAYTFLSSNTRTKHTCVPREYEVLSVRNAWHGDNTITRRIACVILLIKLERMSCHKELGILHPPKMHPNRKAFKQSLSYRISQPIRIYTIGHPDNIPFQKAHPSPNAHLNNRCARTLQSQSPSSESLSRRHGILARPIHPHPKSVAAKPAHSFVVSIVIQASVPSNPTHCVE
mgnify:CR=1 FL=1